MARPPRHPILPSRVRTMSTLMTRRDFGLGLGGAVAAASLGAHSAFADALVTSDITWTSSDPHLSGNFAPIGPEIEARDLPVISGRIPADLSGAYMRNGPNPLFQPLAYFYPMDGDGMIHAVY